MMRGVQNPIRHLLENQTEDYLEWGVFENASEDYHRLGSFRVMRNRTILQHDIVSDEWKVIGICD